MSEPLVFADHVITKILKQTAPDLTPTPEDFELIRSTFRKTDGSWVGLVRGDIEQIKKLKATVSVWVASHAQQQSK